MSLVARANHIADKARERAKYEANQCPEGRRVWNDIVTVFGKPKAFHWHENGNVIEWTRKGES